MFEDKHLHIIAFDVPFPADYGGVIDVFYKLKALNALGLKIHLHCYDYGRGIQKELEKYVFEVFYYKRRSSPVLLFSKIPFIVKTRTSNLMLKRLLCDNHPILFEGLHCCASLNDERIKNRLKIVRTHNIEHDYYSNLAKVENNFFKKLFFAREAKKLHEFEDILVHANFIAAISKNDVCYFSSKFSGVQHISAFHAYEKVDIKLGVGNYALYHGSLGVGENNEAALYLVKKVFSHLQYPFKIAGNNPSEELKNEVNRYSHIELIAELNTEEIYQLISNAQINILPTFQATGIKLKLLAALYSGRHCIVNLPMIKNTGLENLCHIAFDAEEMIALVEKLRNLEFSTEDVQLRKEILNEHIFSNQINAQKIMSLLDKNN